MDTDTAFGPSITPEIYTVFSFLHQFPVALHIVNMNVAAQPNINSSSSYMLAVLHHRLPFGNKRSITHL